MIKDVVGSITTKTVVKVLSQTHRPEFLNKNL